MMQHTGYRWATLAVALAACLLAFALMGCSSGGGSNDRVDAIVAQYEDILNGPDYSPDDPPTEEDSPEEYRQMIEDALDALPASEHDEYLDMLEQSVKEMTDAADEYETEFPSTEGTTPPEGGGM